jgi:predicted dehydrogenase
MKDKARIGVIGAGWWVVENHLPILERRDDVELAAVCRLGKEELERVRERFDFEYATEDYRKILDGATLDGIIVGSPHVLHYEQAKAALQKGAHVLIEKPMTTRAAEARELVELAGQKQLQIVIPYGWNFRPYTREARRLVADGAVGEIEHVVCQMASALRDLFSGEAFQETEGAFFQPAISTWADPEASGGYGWGQLSHALGLLDRIVDLPVDQVFAWMSESEAGVDLYDAINVRFQNGATGVVSGSATVPKHRGFQIDLRIFGSEGMLLFDIERERLEVRRYDGEDTIVPMQPGDGNYACVEPVERFADICLGREAENDAPGEVGMRAVEVLDAAYRSARGGGVEEVRVGA